MVGVGEKATSRAVSVGMAVGTVVGWAVGTAIGIAAETGVTNELLSEVDGTNTISLGGFIQYLTIL
jgi:hypothetical protein